MILILFRISEFRDSRFYNIPNLLEKIPPKFLSTLPFLITFTIPRARTVGLGTTEIPLSGYSAIHDSRTLGYSNSEVVQWIQSVYLSNKS
jgi:hypothetical protein